MRILLIDDSAGTTAMLTTLLQSQGHSVLVAFSGVAGVALALTADPDLVIVDLGLPDVDGIELIKTLRRCRVRKNYQIIVLTGRTDLEARRKAKDAGASHFFTKGADISELLAATAQPTEF